MTGKKLTHAILAAFVAGTLALVYIQYNSSLHINRLIEGNDHLLNEMTVSNQLHDLEKDVLAMESSLRGAVATGDSSYMQELPVLYKDIDADMLALQQLADNDSAIRYIDELDMIVHQKVAFTHSLIDSLQHRGKSSAEKMIAGSEGKILTESITHTIQKIDSTRRKIVSNATMAIDKSGKKALRLGIILIVTVLLSAGALFWYIIHNIQKQARLIAALNESERKVKESAQVKENFMANMSHEIRTPLNAILGFTNLLEQQPLNETAKEYTRTIQRSGENLLTIVNDILDISKIEAGMLRIEATAFSIRGLLQSVMIMFQPKASQKGIDLQVQVDDQLPDTLEGDATRLTQVLVNLLGNALKFTSEGSISVHVFGKRQDNKTVQTHITVADTGIGISPG